MPDPAISIIMPFRDAASTMPLTVASLLESTFTDWELLAVDDGSGDGGPGILSAFNDPRIICISEGRWRGTPCCLNAALDRVRSPLIARVDADDIVWPERLQLQKAFLDAHPGISLIAGRNLVFTDDGMLQGQHRHLSDHDELLRRRWSWIPLHHPTWMGRREWFLGNRYDERFLRSQDQELLLRTSLSHRFASIDAPVNGYRSAKTAMATQIRNRCYHFWALVKNRRVVGVSGLVKGCAGHILIIAGECTASVVQSASGLRARDWLHGRRMQPVPVAETERWGRVWSACTLRAARVLTPRSPLDAPLISIGIPFRNPGPWFEPCLRSVLAQTWSDWELILIDDGSIDGSLELARRVVDPRIRVISDGVNLGLAHRLNQIANEARGRFLFRMDADDMMHPDRLASTIIRLGQAGPDCVVGSWAYAIDRGNSIRGLRLPALDDTGWGARHRFLHPSIAAAREWFLRNPYDTAGCFRRAEDAELWVRTRSTTKRVIIEGPLLYYREVGVFSLANYRDTAKSLRQILRRNPGFSWPTRIYHGAMTRGREAMLGVADRLGMADAFVRRRSRRIGTAQMQAGQHGIDRILATRLPGIDP